MQCQFIWYLEIYFVFAMMQCQFIWYLEIYFVFISSIHVCAKMFIHLLLVYYSYTYTFQKVY